MHFHGGGVVRAGGQSAYIEASLLIWSADTDIARLRHANLLFRWHDDHGVLLHGLAARIRDGASDVCHAVGQCNAAYLVCIVMSSGWSVMLSPSSVTDRIIHCGGTVGRSSTGPVKPRISKRPLLSSKPLLGS
jgi:hypothetical protein